MGLLFRRQFLQTPSCKVSESSWTLNALRLRTHAQGRYHYSVSELVQDCCSLQGILGAGGKGDVRNPKGLRLTNDLGTMVFEQRMRPGHQSLLETSVPLPG